MNQIHLPSLLSLNVKNFSLYPNNGGLDFNYDFKNGLNLIIGGNGTGKTTLTKLIKYALIGHYREMTDVSTYQKERRQKRPEYPKNYYRNRMDSQFINNSMAEVTLNFKINDIEFIVTRNIYEIKLTRALYIQSGEVIEIKGELITQDKYEKLEVKDKSKYLQYNYENIVAQTASIADFDGIIFFVNEILYFGEDRKLILWDWDLQEELSSKYFNDFKLDKERKNLLLDQKYQDTLGRQTSEEIKAIRDAIKRVVDKEKNISQQNPYNKLNELKQKLEREENKINFIQKRRVELTESRKYLNSNRIKNTQEVNIIDRDITTEEEKIHNIIWRNKNPKYEIYVKHINSNHSCPACNQALKDVEIQDILGYDENCFVCHKPIKNYDKKSPIILDLQNKKNEINVELRNTEKEIIEIEKELDTLDTDFNKLDISLFNLRSQIRTLDFELNQAQSTKDKTVDSNDFKYKLELEIKELEEARKKHQEESKKYSDEVAKISNQMNDKKAEILKELSQIFSTFASSFLGVSCRLISEDVVIEKGKKVRVFLPLVGNEIIPRGEPEEFSESQRFFIDLSFRMSLLNLFYKQSSFFICETPDSSLDIAYERNAANVFLEYMKQKNSLIITSNLNNSDFLSYLSKNSPEKNYINLLKIGRVSSVQSSSQILNQVSHKIEQIINERE